MAINYSLTKNPVLRQFPEKRAHLNIVLKQARRVPAPKDISGGELGEAILSKTQQVHVVTGLETAGASLYCIEVAWTHRVYRIYVSCPPEGSKDPTKLTPLEIRVTPQPWNPAASSAPPDGAMVAAHYQQQMEEEGEGDYNVTGFEEEEGAYNVTGHESPYSKLAKPPRPPRT